MSTSLFVFESSLASFTCLCNMLHSSFIVFHVHHQSKLTRTQQTVNNLRLIHWHLISSNVSYYYRIVFGFYSVWYSSRITRNAMTVYMIPFTFLRFSSANELLHWNLTANNAHTLFSVLLISESCKRVEITLQPSLQFIHKLTKSHFIFIIHDFNKLQITHHFLNEKRVEKMMLTFITF